MKPLRAKIRCVAVLSCALHPFAVITASFKGGPTYVWLDYEDRAALGDLWSAHGISKPYSLSIPVGYPTLVRGHGIDAESGEVFEGKLSRPGDWISAEGLWVHTEVAQDAILALRRYRKETPARSESIAAPSWRVLTCVRALALAAGLSDPGVNREAERAAG